MGSVYKDFKVDLLDNQLDERLTNGRLDLTGLLNYLVKVRLFDSHKVNREKDESHESRLRFA